MSSIGGQPAGTMRPTLAAAALLALPCRAAAAQAFVCTCACCESCPTPAEDVGSFPVSDCGLCSPERCSAALPLPVGACPPAGQPGATVSAKCTAAEDTPFVTVAQYMEDICLTPLDPPETYILGHCYTRVDAGLSTRWDCAGRQASRTEWYPSFGAPPPSPGCVDAEGMGPLRMGAPVRHALLAPHCRRRCTG